MNTVDELAAAVAGPVLRPGDAGYDAEVAGFNTAARHDAAVVVGATSAADVAAAVRFAADAGRPVVVLSTGHGGVSSAGAVVISTRRMAACRVDPTARTAWVQAGVRWHQVVAAAAPHGLAPLNGSAPHVGVVGYTLGGGLPMMGREYGWAADHVREIEVVTADGGLRRTDPTHDPELFWALRGGKGNFGVVTSMEFDLVPVARIYGGGLVFPGIQAADILHAYRRWTLGLPDAASSAVALMRLPDDPAVPQPLRGTCTVHLHFAYTGSAAEGQALLAPMRAAGTPMLDWVRDMPYHEVGTIANDPTEPLAAWDNGSLLAELTAETVDALLAVAGPHLEVSLAMVQLRHLGGALGRPPRQPNAVNGRDAAFNLGVVAPFPEALREVVPGAVNAVVAAVAPWSTGGVSLNFVAEARTPDQVGRAWPASTYRRLLDVKRMYDPHNVFRGGFAVLPQAPTATGRLAR